MQPSPLISICIPAYKRAELLKRLLDSIAIQDWKDFEVIVTDDSPDGSVSAVCRQYEGLFPLYYYHNSQALGTPENWNEGIGKANGKWIKLMHDDDWFASRDSLATFAAAAGSLSAAPPPAAISSRHTPVPPRATFIFSAYSNIYPDGRKKDIQITPSRYGTLLKKPATLLAGNCIGPPSCVLFKKREGLFFDRRFKWLVDIDFYIRYLQAAPTTGRLPDDEPQTSASAPSASIPHSPSPDAPYTPMNARHIPSADAAYYIPQPLVNIGISETQVTRDSFGVRSVEIPENLWLLEKIGPAWLKNLRIFDHCWRLIRNLQISHEKEIREAGFSGPIPARISAMIRFQGRIPKGLLNIGPVSKILMTSCYILS
ncbi:MAG TPA: glycosyltransferase [Puia sp.]|nr:glycosyltransferase [Puia sp.]